MATLNSKNELQEWCQKRKVALPTYSSHQRGEAHVLQWSSEVMVMGKKHGPGLARQRKRAEMRAAEVALKWLAGHKDDYVPKTVGNGTVCDRVADTQRIVFLDLENSSCESEWDTLLAGICKPYYVYAVDSEASMLADKLNLRPSWRRLRAPSNGSDAADLLILYEVMRVVHQGYDTADVYIVSKDKLFATLKDMSIKLFPGLRMHIVNK